VRIQGAEEALEESIAQTHGHGLLVGIWLDDYRRRLGRARSDIVQTTSTRFSYLFDIANERLIAAWGFSLGKDAHARDKSRMARHPLGAGPGYHRGHAIPHSLGGGTDINLTAQLGSLNTGEFRKLEIEAVATPGALYFTYWRTRTPRASGRARSSRACSAPTRTP